MYDHFAKRLKQRYGLDITETEYYELCDTTYTTVKVRVGRKTVIILFKGVPIYAVKQKKKMKLLVTALPMEIYLRHLKEKQQCNTANKRT